VNPQELVGEIIEKVQGTWRYRWWAAGVTWVVCAAGWAYVYTIPDVYQASARVYVDTNSLLKPLMQGLSAQQNTLNEVQLVSSKVLTRPNLEVVARETDLDLRTDTTEEFEALVTALQKLIRVTGGRDNIFTIQYEDNDRDKARDVVAAVLDTFVEDAIGAQGDDSEVTERAVAGEIRDHEERLSRAEAALAQFKKENLGYMPGESGDYYSRLQTSLGEVSTVQTKIRQLQERRDELSRQIEGEEPVFGIVSTLGGGAPACVEQGQIAELQTQMSKLLVDFTDKHPRVLALKDQIALLEARCAESGASAGAPLIPAGADGDTLELNPVYQNLRVQLSNTDVELVDARGQLKARESAVERLRRDVDKIAQVETELKQLNRDYSVVQGRHQELIKRWEDLQAKKRLDPVTDNVQFRRIEPPFAFADPVGPNRPLFLAAVLLFGLGLGGVIAYGMNHVQPVYFSRRGIRKGFGLPVLGSITMLLDPVESRRRRTAAVAWAGSYFLLFVSTVLVVGFASRGSELLRGLMERMAT
jgi:polysaccharide chain length determinant protein (PEP-CTERM system associated)